MDWKLVGNFEEEGEFYDKVSDPLAARLDNAMHQELYEVRGHA
jgi:hypothetical protein